MVTSHGHLEMTALADLAQGRLGAKEQSASLAHLSTCSRCATELQQMENVIQLMATDRSEDAPRDVVQYALKIFQQRSLSQEPSLLQRMVAVLTFDSWTSRPAFGFRSGATLSRQMIYSASEHDVDLRLTPEGANWIIAGQVLGQDCAGGEVTLESESCKTAALLNDLCEFRLPPVSAGNYTLRLRLANLEVEVPQLDLRAEHGA